MVLRNAAAMNRIMFIGIIYMFVKLQLAPAISLVEFGATHDEVKVVDEIQAKMKDTVLRNAIVWSNTSP